MKAEIENKRKAIRIGNTNLISENICGSLWEYYISASDCVFFLQIRSLLGLKQTYHHNAAMWKIFYRPAGFAC